MQKKLSSLVVFILLSNLAWSQETHHDFNLSKIECSLESIERSKIHPEEKAASTSQSSSSNWSGYVAAPNFKQSQQGSVTCVTGTWTVPTLIATADTTYSAIWVGIDGYLDSTVEQIGTSHNWENGSQKNYAWFEMYPNGAYEINGFPVDNGDVITATVNYAGHDVFHMSLSNHTKGVTTTIPVSYTTAANVQRNSAEWIVEAPYSGSILPLSDFQLATLTNCSAIINGVCGGIDDMCWQNDLIIMSSGNTEKAKPSQLFNNGTSFQVAWEHE